MVDLCRKYIILNRKWSKTTGFLINFDIFNQIRSIFVINWLFRYKSTRFNPFGCGDLIWFQELGSKKLIKSWFEYDFKGNLAQGRSNRLSLMCGVWKLYHMRNSKWPTRYLSMTNFRWPTRLCIWPTLDDLPDFECDGLNLSITTLMYS